jgi:phosphate transport system substrate-binding protein
MKKKSVLLAAALLPALCPGGAALADGARNYLYIVGSTTLAPFSEEVSKHLTKSAKLKPPLLESNGTNGGFKLFCEGLGMDFPDIVDASRPIKRSEYAACESNGAGDLLEVKIGYDGIVVANSKKAKPMELTLKELYLALSKQVPEPSCKQNCETLVPNPYQTWKQINPALPDVKIEVIGPPVSSGTAEVIADAVIEAGCDSHPALAAKRAKNLKEYNRICRNLRDDGVYSEETSENIPALLEARPEAVGIINFNRLKENASRLQAAKLDGVAPTYDNIAQRSYPISRPLYFYAKKGHIDRLPGFKAYLAEFTSEKAIGPKGYLLPKGLVAMQPQELKAFADDTKTLKSMVLDADHKP